MGSLHQASKVRWSSGFGIFVGTVITFQFRPVWFGLLLTCMKLLGEAEMLSIIQQEEGRVETLDWWIVKLLLSYYIRLHFLLFIDLLGSTRGCKLLYVGELIMHLGWIRAVKEVGTTHWKVDGQCPCFEKCLSMIFFSLIRDLSYKASKHDIPTVEYHREERRKPWMNAYCWHELGLVKDPSGSDPWEWQDLLLIRLRGTARLPPASYLLVTNIFLLHS